MSTVLMCKARCNHSDPAGRQVVVRSLFARAAIALICAGLAACAGAPTQPVSSSAPTSAAPVTVSTAPTSSNVESTTTSATTPSPSSASTVYDDPSLLPPVKSTDPSESVSLMGTPTAGVEQGCLVLDGYLLIGGPRELLASGEQLAVTGRVSTGLVTTCQQGVPLQVDSAQSIAPITT